jgi:hypothetical protein
VAPFDYTTPSDVFAYGNSAGTATDPVNESAIMADLVTGMSRAIDAYCGQALSVATYAAQTCRALVDRDGVLSCYPPVPTMAVPTAADWRTAKSSNWTALSSSNLDIEINSFGCVCRVLNGSYLGWRGTRVQMRLSYTGGWASLAAVPPDFEWAMRSLCWWAYQKRSAPSDRTAIPDLGVLIIPGNWPPHIKTMFKPYVRWIPM